MSPRGRLALATLMLLLVAPARAAGSEDAAWAALVAGGHVALIRHGSAPPGYGGDPPGFRLDDCSTQRNLDERGREQARAVGEAFRARGVPVDAVKSSPWCRCLDTAALMAVGPVERSYALIPAVPANPNAAAALRELKEMISGWKGPGTLVLVAHALTASVLLGGILPGQAETLVLKPAPGTAVSAEVVGRIPPPR
jgi:phosphohistidine phosphatase SixA